MYSLFNQHLAEEHMRVLRQEAEIMHRRDSVMHEGKTGLARFWYMVLGLSVPEYGTSAMKVSQALVYDWWRQRTRVLMRVIGLIAFALGILIGSVLSSSSNGLFLPLLLAGMVTLLVSLPMMVRLLLMMKGHVWSGMAHR